MLRKSLILLVLLAALISASVFVASAQSDDPEPTPFALGHMHMGGMMGGHGMMMGRGMGRGMMGDEAMPMLSVAAEALGLEQDALIEALHSGQTLAQIAEAQGVELATVQEAILTGAENHMAEMVTAGVLTQEQADEHLAQMHDNIDAMPMFSSDGSCPMMGEGIMNSGMRGHHMQMGQNS